MFQKDYILRMLEMLAELIAGILGYIRKGNFTRAEESLNGAYYNLLKEDAAFFHSIPKDKLTKELMKKHYYTHDHLQVLAELFFAEAELRYAKGLFTKSRECYEKSLILFEFIENESDAFSLQRQSKVNSILQKISEIEKR